MHNLTKLTKPENCFYTVDSHTLRNLQELFEYLMNCEPESYKRHANDQKNDFADWIRSVLLFPSIADTFAKAKDINMAKDILAEFFQRFDYRSTTIPDTKYFFTIEDCKLKNIHELYYYLNNCSPQSYEHHVTIDHNDFAIWINDVLSYPNLASSLKNAKNQDEARGVIKGFLVDNQNASPGSEYERYMNEHRIKNLVVKDSENSKSGSTEQQNPAAKIETETKKEVKTEAKSFVGTESFTIPLKSSQEVEPEEQKANEPLFTKDNFRQFTDEELDKFSVFIKNEKTTEMDPRVEYLHGALQELKNMIKELRTHEKDPLIADLMLRAISAKIDYYDKSKSMDDYNHIISMMKEAQIEIEETDNQKNVNFAEEIMKDLQLQTISLKKHDASAE